MIVTAWYFTDEDRTLIGPYTTEADAQRSNELYDKWRDGPLTEAEDAEADALNERSTTLSAWIKKGRPG